MPDVNDIIRELTGPLRVEGRTGYRDTTIIGASIGDYARAWAGRAREAGVSEAQRARCGEISVLLAEYRKLGPQGRKQRVEQALGLLGEMGKKDCRAGVPTPAKSSVPTPANDGGQAPCLRQGDIPALQDGPTSP